MQRDEIILVTGATGQQGGAVAKHLLEDGWRVRALTRNPNSEAAQALGARGAELVTGDLLDRESLDRAVAGAYGVYSVQNTRTAGLEGELAEGANIAEAAAAADIAHFVYSSAVSADPQTRDAYMLSKERIEERIHELGLPATIWRPVSFMENFGRQRESILSGKLVWPLWPESMTYFIAIDDIGRFVALSFREPERLIGADTAIAGDAMTMAEVAETFGKTLRRQVEFVHVDELAGIKAPSRPVPGEPQFVRADVEACRAMMPGLTTLTDWIETSGWA